MEVMKDRQLMVLHLMGAAREVEVIRQVCHYPKFTCELQVLKEKEFKRFLRHNERP